MPHEYVHRIQPKALAVILWVAGAVLIGGVIQPLLGAAVAGVGGWRTTGKARVLLLAIAVLLVLFALLLTPMFGLSTGLESSSSGS